MEGTDVLMAQAITAVLSTVVTYLTKKYMPMIPNKSLPAISTICGMLLMGIASYIGTHFGLVIDTNAINVLLAGAISGSAGIGVRENTNQLVTKSKAGDTPSQGT